jgi:hypothetical protein
MSVAQISNRRSWHWFVAWLIVGAAAALGLISSLGIFLLPAAGLASLILANHHDAGRGIQGVVAGMGIGPLIVAYLNRDGPGDICSGTARAIACSQRWSPWPWLAAGVVLLALGTAWFIIDSRTAHAGHEQ